MQQPNTKAVFLVSFVGSLKTPQLKEGILLS